MARKPQQPGESPKSDRENSDREKIIDAFMALLAERPFDEIGFGDIAGRAGVTLVQCRNEFGSTVGIIAAFVKEIDRKVLAGGAGDMGEEPPRERLFDVLMRRIETLGPYKEAVRSLMRSAPRNPGLAFALNGLAVRSQGWMLTAADIDAAGMRGAMRAQGLAALFASVLRTWVDDDDPGLARTMAALDRALARGQRWSNLCDDLARFSPTRLCRRDERRSRRREEDIGEAPASAV